MTYILRLPKFFLDSLEDSGGEGEGGDEVDVDLTHLAVGDL